jgi:hypothetical protein
MSSSTICYKLTVRLASLGETLRAYAVNDRADRYRPDKCESDYPASRLPGHPSMVALVEVLTSGDCISLADITGIDASMAHDIICPLQGMPVGSA